MSNIILPYKFNPYPYQMNFWNQMWDEHKQTGKKLGLMVWSRRSGKDLNAWNYMIKQSYQRPGNYYYFLETAEKGRDVIWEGKTDKGRPFLDYIPEDDIAKSNDNRMRLILKNGSLIKINGADRGEAVGTNPCGIVFSEYSLYQRPEVFQYVVPIIIKNGGWVILIYTPRGMNHGYDQFQVAKNRPQDWFCELLTVDDVCDFDGNRLYSDKEIEEYAIKYGMSDEIVQSEFYCSWSEGLTGSYYNAEINEARDDGRIGDFPYKRVNGPVYTAWDLGFKDATAVWFFQVIDRKVRIIDYYESIGQSIEKHIEMLQTKQMKNKYLYGKHFLPFDSKRKDSRGVSVTLEIFKKWGIPFEILEKEASIQDGIQESRALLPRCEFNASTTRKGVLHLDRYKKKWDRINKRYSDTPLRDEHKDAADAFRYVAKAVKKIHRGVNSITKEKIQELEARYAFVA